jgi:3-hydroxyacyl-[acyl-carrier-protein] dehydratase
MDNHAEQVTEIDINDIMRRIPHRYPFLMIDRITDMVLDQKATGIKCVSMGEPYFQGHFPTLPVMPGVLIVEAMAQTAAVLVVSTLGRDAEGKLVYFMSIDKARFRKPVGPGDMLHVQVIKNRQRGNVWRFSGTVRVNDRVVADAVFSAMIMDN